MNASEREGTKTELFSCSALQGRMQCTAGKGHIMVYFLWQIRDPSSGVLPSRQRLGGVSYKPRAMPPVTQSSALQAPEC